MSLTMLITKKECLNQQKYTKLKKQMMERQNLFSWTNMSEKFPQRNGFRVKRFVDSDVSNYPASVMFALHARRQFLLFRGFYAPQATLAIYTLLALDFRHLCSRLRMIVFVICSSKHLTYQQDHYNNMMDALISVISPPNFLSF